MNGENARGSASQTKETMPDVPQEIAGQVSPLRFIESLRWLNTRPMIELFDSYRLQILEQALFSFDESGRPAYNLVLCGRGKKNWKTADLCIAALYRLLVWQSFNGSNECYILANDKDQAADDLKLVKKIIDANDDELESLLLVKKDIIERRDGKGFLEILPAGDIAGSHGKTALFVGFDEIHSYRNWDIFEALALDPSRPDSLHWITSYASLYHRPGIPLFDLMATGKKGVDPRMFFSWYGGDYTTDPDFTDATPEQRANPSMALWGNDEYLAQQKLRLPSHKFRRLHLNLPGLPEGSAYSVEMIDAAIERGVKIRPPVENNSYFGFVDMSGGSSDDAVLAIAHRDADGRGILDRVMNQGQPPPFDPRTAVEKFVEVLQDYGISAVTGDRYAGETFRADFRKLGISYIVAELTKSELYSQLEPRLNSGNAVLLDNGTMESQLLGLVWRGNRIDHPSGEHDDFANAAAGAIHLAMNTGAPMEILTCISPESQALQDFFNERPTAGMRYDF